MPAAMLYVNARPSESAAAKFHVATLPIGAGIGVVVGAVVVKYGTRGIPVTVIVTVDEAVAPSASVAVTTATLL